MSSPCKAGPVHGPAFPYPSQPFGRNRWVLDARSGVDRDGGSPRRPAGFLWESEWQRGGEMAPGLTVFLSNRECPWRCVMCDLWRHAMPGRVEEGDILAQLDEALASRGSRRMDWLKLYNAGSFFDHGAIPPSAYEGIAVRCSGVGQLVVESHPALVGPRIVGFRQRLPTGVRLEVAMGLETVHPEAHALLNKRTSPGDFERAAAWLRDAGMDVRLFLLTRPPFLGATAAREWLFRSVDMALDMGGDPVVVIPTRGGNGAMERLQAAGQWEEAPLEWLEDAVLHGRSRGLGRVLADTWGLSERFAGQPGAVALIERLEKLNRGE